MINTTHAHAHVQDDRELVQYLNAGRNHAKTIATIKIELCAHRSALHRQRSQPHPTQDPMAVKPTGDRTHRAYRKRRPQTICGGMVEMKNSVDGVDAEYCVNQFVVRINYLQGERIYHYQLFLDADLVHDTSKHGGFESMGELNADVYRQIRNMELES